MLNELIEKFRTKNRPAGILPLDNLAATHLWVAQLQQMHEYEAHQQVVLMLDQYNRLTTPFDDQRLHILGLIEHFGSKLQYGLIAQFLKNQADLKYAGHSFWQEIVAFYWQLARAYRRISFSAPSHQKHIASLPTMVLRALHYQGKLIQWRYIRYELPTPKIWNLLHKLYQCAVKNGFSKQSIVLKGSAYCSCEQIYSRILLLHLMRPVGLSPSEVELAAYWAWKWRDTVNLSETPDANKHTHFVTLQDSAPPQSLHRHANQPVFGRYWSVTDTITKLKVMQVSLSQNSNSTVLYGVPYTDNKNSLLCHIHDKLTSKTSTIHNHITSLTDEINISCGQKNIVTALDNPASGQYLQAHHKTVGHPDEAYYCLNFNEVDNSICKPAPQSLLITSFGQKSEISTLAVIRWAEQSTAPNITLGMERLGIAPRLVALQPISEAIMPSPFMQPSADSEQIAIILNKPSTLVSFHVITQKYLDIRDGDYIYRIRIQGILEQTPQWLRLQFSRLSRSYRPIQTINSSD